MKANAWLVLVTALAAGCVSIQKFEETESALGACRQELDAARAKAKEDQAASQAARQRLEGELAACQELAAAAQLNIRRLETLATELREKMKTEIGEMNVEIEQLRDQLSVRVLDRILFNSGSADILPKGKRVLDKLAAVLAATDEMIRVEGHTDNVPIGMRLKEKYPSNWELSTARASSVVRYFEYAHNINVLRMEAVGFSRFRPVAHGETAADLARNRRVEIVLTAARPAP
jgi:chemotaxis protein MotB